MELTVLTNTRGVRAGLFSYKLLESSKLHLDRDMAADGRFTYYKASHSRTQLGASTDLRMHCEEGHQIARPGVKYNTKVL